LLSYIQLTSGREGCYHSLLKNKSKYLTIAESRPAKEGDKKYTRSSIMIFDSQAEKFREALDEALKIIQK
jgi:hypothetical protein